MKRGFTLLAIVCAILLFHFAFVNEILLEKFLMKTTGKLISNFNSEIPSFGPSQEEINCMQNCMGCTSRGEGCTGNQDKCMEQCNAKKPEQTSQEKCVEDCALKECDQYDFICQAKNRNSCDDECGMLGDKPDESSMSEEQKCITDCVNLHSPVTRCQASQEGEKGNDVCKMCANQCVHLYAGPCLGEEKLEEKKKSCETCEHCYGEPVMGDSGEGWECIVDVECKDATKEFGNESGTGEGIEKIGNAIGNVFEGIGNFFSGLFNDDKNAEKNYETENTNLENEIE